MDAENQGGGHGVTALIIDSTLDRGHEVTPSGLAHSLSEE